MLTLDLKNMFGVLSDADFAAMEPELEQARKRLLAGGPFSGWTALPAEMLAGGELPRIHAAARRIRESFDALVVVGIGGSYLGARAFMEMLRLPKDPGPEIVFLGTGFDADELTEALEKLEGRDFAVNVVSKSGGTMEPAVTLRILRERLERRWGSEGAAARIFATTDREKGALHDLAAEKGYETFTVPGNVGGRYSVLSAVGLLPLAVGGVDIDAMLTAAAETSERLLKPGMGNIAWQYAAARNLLYRRGKKIELLAVTDARLRFVAEWWKQLYGESEGKDGKGIFPASCQFPADLHSLGQYIQQGERHLFETALVFQRRAGSLAVPAGDDRDGLGYLAGRDLQEVERLATRATLLAHADGGVPNCTLALPARDAASAGELIQFFETACALSGYVLGVEPFDQPGVEAYKKNVSALLGKPGCEDLRREIEGRIL